ncbi:MAG: hypothetical protein A2268_08180 [Candidatus Raymondbacteria bacterium RifOxyA12_full_50_37]|uniref:DUF4160 domain-containing protein n=1 Tax=Candidatus Raymondbacteria bacterium RIFOXYD12_FULL_49_13 TaxID=1817890 RepID=A0A1F7FCZ4_UNCRA|nr:MAG: hypothetical protein A2268_08180 [Candidatus Raymondbacteria bacterium RifOxyA12_full_50_37]OGJ93544.1 MAG: hypothetical protein A2248_09225 [Candidatus Raymondbacteria bacterium RIFOXYA2_FULL_49_16]OGJ98814.1 MAG: hypothetical protein A2453_10035 [Candidatus Raymondbacteria bacterium RIFOXYC2_FULL_50_21]OGK02439.1 MAG: hypothetical protein A2350_11535 [Candidatus Raymondbacteria bacterium RifOxyB12_full_50_8]OGK04544.1 MAG: hypothetical protein A2519_07170 [Candidatus Raymondbacteria b
MPKLFEIQGYKFFFFSNEGLPLEPCHVHVRKGSQRAKFWMVPVVSLANSWGMNAQELNLLEKIVEGKTDIIKEKWYAYFSA